MNGKQLTVMWLLIFLVLAQFYFNNQFSILWSYISNPSKGSPNPFAVPPGVTPIPPHKGNTGLGGGKGNQGPVK